MRDLIGEAKLTVPAGVNYDLFLWSSCNTLVASSTNGTGTDESVLGTITKESLAISDTQDYYLEVRYVGGGGANYRIQADAGGGNTGNAN